MARDPEIIHKTMSAIRGRDTGIELSLRRALSEKGVRYRLYSSRVYGHPDLVIPAYRIAIFCDSEFWHGKDFEENEAKIKSHRDYWIPKILRNKARDEEVNRELSREGYEVLRFWGEEIQKELPRVVEKILACIAERKKIEDTRARIKEFTTLCYLEKGDAYLLLHRVKKEHDLNEGKWIGVGGHLEAGESPASCMKREIREETGFAVEGYRYLGKIDFLNDAYPPERMYLYKVTSFEGTMIDCDEGVLRWVKKSEMPSLPMWEGDKAFLPLLDAPEERPFSMTLLYEGGALAKAMGPFYPPCKKGKAKKKRKKGGTHGRK